VLKKLKKALGLGDDLASLPSELLSDAGLHIIKYTAVDSSGFTNILTGTSHGTYRYSFDVAIPDRCVFYCKGTVYKQPYIPISLIMSEKLQTFQSYFTFNDSHKSLLYGADDEYFYISGYYGYDGYMDNYGDVYLIY
jgi:hypothetical protein